MKKIFTFFIAFISVFATTKAADVVFNVVVPTPTYQCWVVGNFNGWNNNLHQMTKVDDTHYTITIAESAFTDQTVTQANIKYKYLSGGGDWAYVEKDATGAEISDRNYAATDTVKTWAMTFNPNVAPIPADILIEAYVAKAVTELYLTGSFNGWKSPGADGTKMTYSAADSDANGNFYSMTIHTDDANKLAYKFAAGPSWTYQQTAGDMKLADPTVKQVLHDSVPFNRIYPGLANCKTVTMNVTVPANTANLYMMGSHLGWDGTSWAAGTKNNDGTFTFVIPSQDLFEYKYFNGQSWDNFEIDAAGTGVGNRTADAQIKTTFNDVIVDWKIKTGLKGLDADKYSVYTRNNSIVVEGVTTKAELFDISGRNLQTVNAAGTYTSMSLNKGLYVIRIDGATMKVAVK
jgi:hypothetical protein